MSAKTSCDWSNDKCLELIEEVRANPVVWDVSHPDYYNKLKRADGWQEISREMKETAEECEKKMSSLRGSYRREKGREKKTRPKGTGTDNAYTSKWFAFNYMKFLDDKALRPRNTVNSLQMTVDSDQVHYSSVGDTEDISCDQEGAHESSSRPTTLPTTTVDELHVTMETAHAEDTHTSMESFPEQSPSTSTQNARPLSKPQKVFKSPRKVLKRTHSRPIQIQGQSVHSAHLDKALGVLEEFARPQLKDECSTFGEFISQKLRRFNSRLRAIAQHRIHQVLFDLEMGTEKEVMPPGLIRDAPVSSYSISPAYVSHSPSSPYSCPSCRPSTQSEISSNQPHLSPTHVECTSLATPLLPTERS